MVKKKKSKAWHIWTYSTRSHSATLSINKGPQQSDLFSQHYSQVRHCSGKVLIISATSCNPVFFHIFSLMGNILENLTQELRKQSPVRRDYTACYRHRKLVTPQMFHNWGSAQCQRLYGPTKHLPKINPARYRHILCSRKSDEYFTKQNIHHRQSFMSRTWWYPCAPLGLSRVSQISLKFQLRLCAAPQWLGERSTGEEK